jgi:hypothetical protein
MQDIKLELKRTGLTPTRVREGTSDAPSSGIVFIEIDNLILKIIRDRGQDFVELGPRQQAECFHQMVDVEVAFGWRTTEDVLSLQTPDSLSSIFNSIAQHLSELQQAFDLTHGSLNMDRIKLAARRRSQAFALRLRS